MIDVNKAVIARLKKGGEDFEVLVDCDKAIEFRSGKAELEDVLASETIYKDSKKGEKAPENEMYKLFSTEDEKEIITQIIKKGEIQLTTEHRSKLREEKRKKIINLINRNAVDSKTGLPHPSTRIEKAMDEARVNVDEFKSAEAQIEDVLDKIRSVIPIKFVVKEVEVKVPANFSGSSYGVVKQFGKILNESWGNDGSLILIVEIPGGLQDEFFDKLNNLTHGEVESKVIRERE